MQDLQRRFLKQLMTKNSTIIALCTLIIAINKLDAMEQFSNTVKRIRDYSPYLVVPAFNVGQYKYRQTIPIKDRYLPTVPAYLAPTAASVIVSALLNRDLGWHNAIGWSLFKNIPAWLSTAVCAYRENINDKHQKNTNLSNDNALIKSKTHQLNIFKNTLDTPDTTAEEISQVINHINNDIKVIEAIDSTNSYLFDATKLLEKANNTLNIIQITKPIKNQLEGLRNALDNNEPTSNNLNKIIKALEEIPNNINTKPIIPEQIANSYIMQSNDLLNQAHAKLHIISIAEDIQQKITDAPLLKITKTLSDNEKIEQQINNLKIDSSHYLEKNITGNYDELLELINTLASITKSTNNIPTLISLFYITDILNEQITKNTKIQKDSKTLLHNAITQQYNNITKQLEESAIYDYPLIAKFINNFILKNLFHIKTLLNTTDICNITANNFSNNVPLQRAITKIMTDIWRFDQDLAENTLMHNRSKLISLTNRLYAQQTDYMLNKQNN